MHLELLFYETCCMQLKSTISLKQNSELVNTQVSPPMQQFNYQGGVQTTFNIQKLCQYNPHALIEVVSNRSHVNILHNSPSYPPSASQGKTGPPKVPKQGSCSIVVSLREAGALHKQRENNYVKDNRQ